MRHRAFLAQNALGTVPLFIDARPDGNERRMTESCAVPLYLAKCLGPTPLDVSHEEPDFANFLNWLHHADATLTHAAPAPDRFLVVISLCLLSLCLERDAEGRGRDIERNQRASLARHYGHGTQPNSLSVVGESLLRAAS